MDDIKVEYIIRIGVIVIVAVVVLLALTTSNPLSLVFPEGVDDVIVTGDNHFFCHYVDTPQNVYVRCDPDEIGE